MNWWVETYLGRIRLECVDIVGDQCIFRGTLVCVYGPLSDTPNFKVGQTVDIDQVHLVKKGVK